ncbi:MAG: HAD hydrolase family protein [Patescibacteria group bacterium]
MSQEKILNKLKPGKLLLSIDLDNTLVNRDKGANFVKKESLDLLKKIKELSDVKLLINTGRENYGYRSFASSLIDPKNAIIGSGSVIIHNGEYFLNDKSLIDKELVEKIIGLVNEGNLEFVDMAHFSDRSIISNPSFRDNALYLAQNPVEWFTQESRNEILLGGRSSTDKVYRIEYPVYKDNNKEFFNALRDKHQNCIRFLSKIIGFPLDENRYTLKRKAHFCDQYKGKVLFARLEVSEQIVNKGTGLHKWFEIEGDNKINVLHIGDSDKGIVNDTIIKKEIPESLIVMVGEKFDKSNPFVDVYFEGDVDEDVYQILKLVYERYA